MKIDMRDKDISFKYDMNGFLEEIIIEDKFDLLKVLEDDKVDCLKIIKERLKGDGIPVKDVKYWDCSEIMIIFGTLNTKEISKSLRIKDKANIWGISSSSENFDYQPVSVLNVHKLKEMMEK